jgi:hypothetical protein
LEDADDDTDQLWPTYNSGKHPGLDHRTAAFSLCIFGKLSLSCAEALEFLAV